MKSEWPAGALVAVINVYGGDQHSIENGTTVEVSGYHPHVGYFECYQIDREHSMILCKRAELDAQNQFTEAYLDNCVEVAVEMYEDEVYELRDALDKLGIAVKAQSIDVWDDNQRRVIWSWINAIASGAIYTAKPKELEL